MCLIDSVYAPLSICTSFLPRSSFASYRRLMRHAALLLPLPLFTGGVIVTRHAAPNVTSASTLEPHANSCNAFKPYFRYGHGPCANSVLPMGGAIFSNGITMRKYVDTSVWRIRFEFFYSSYNEIRELLGI